MSAAKKQSQKASIHEKLSKRQFLRSNFQLSALAILYDFGAAAQPPPRNHTK
ncbi:hypothetical protein [Chryseobacterium salviniae]|uniref:Uncharacterized protein n=1 Tax=Chryseobacterium salviniae TaxID=3101750 RepID=A0ABU6HUT2_9FLAO|nr:hypothetical protein [Chryseobacterium sp. T9W2-O]MEC3876814.1 hypothetical protein [Chryseobacterium sp. T9W2-O]